MPNGMGGEPNWFSMASIKIWTFYDAVHKDAMIYEQTPNTSTARMLINARVFPFFHIYTFISIEYETS